MNLNWWRDYGEGANLCEILDKHVGEDIIVFDTETTGLSAANCHIISISAIRLRIEENGDLTEIDRFNEYINPGYKLSEEIVKLTGITDEFLADKPKEMEIFPKIHEYFGDDSIVCGHNSTFDVGFMDAMYSRQALHKTNFTKLDTCTMARELHRKQEGGNKSDKLLPNHKLGTLAQFFGLDYGLTFHNSMDDVVATTRLLRLFIEEYREKQAAMNNEPEKIKTKIVNCWPFTGYKGMQRLYVKVAHENRRLWINQRRPYEWGEKDPGSLEMFDMHDIEDQVLKLYKCETLEELSKVRESKYAR